MRPLRVVLIILATALVAAGSGLAGGTANRRFMVTGHATLTKRWTYTTAHTANGCTTRISARGSRTIVLRTVDLELVRAAWAGGSARARFAGAIQVSGTVTQSGTKTTRVTGAGACATGTRTARCARVRRTFSGRAVALVSRRAHRIGFRPLRGIVAPAFYGGCPGEPTEIRNLSNGLEAADVGYKETELFAPSTGGYGVGGDTTLTTHVYKAPGVAVQRIRWSLLFRRVG